WARRAGDQRGPPPQLHPRPRPRQAFPPAARSRHPCRHSRRGGHGDPAVLRLADRKGDRLGAGPGTGARPLPPRAERVRGGRHPDHDRRRRRGDPERRLRPRELLDEVSRGGLAAGALRGGDVTSRREARRAAVFRLFQGDVPGEPRGATYEGDIDDFARETAEGVAARAAELDRRIDEATEDWPAERLGALERSVLRVGIYELERGEVPTEVVIDEAVRLAKRYSSNDAGRLVNGILGRVARETARQ